MAMLRVLWYYVVESAAYHTRKRGSATDVGRMNLDEYITRYKAAARRVWLEAEGTRQRPHQTRLPCPFLRFTRSSEFKL